MMILLKRAFARPDTMTPRQQPGASLCPGEFGIGLLQSNLDTSDTLDTKIGISSQVLNPHGTNPKNVSNVSDVSDVSENRTNRATDHARHQH